MDEEEERRIGRAVVRSSDRAREIEVASDAVILERKARDQASKDLVQDRLNSMSSQAMDALQMGLQSEDEGIRMKALAIFMDRRAPRVGVVREETVIEVVDEVKKMTLEEIEIILKKKGLVDEGSN